nr:LytTR family DNA-binding domain-containing protein [Brevibacillus migulae]
MNSLPIPSLLQLFQELYPVQASIAVSDVNQYTYYQPSKFVQLPIQPGDQIIEGSLTYQALTAQKKIADAIGPHVFGVPYYGMSVPVFEQGQATGCITVILPSKPAQLSFLTVKTEDRWAPVRFEHIVYLESQQRKTFVKSEKATGLHKCNLSELEFLLPPEQFIRVHRSYIVNVNYIREIQPDSHSTFLLIMKDQTKIPVSQSYASLFRRALLF